MEFRLAKKNEISDICALYDEVRGKDFCVWNEDYPTIRDAEADYLADCLFILEYEGKIAGACSIVPQSELEGFSCFSVPDRESCEIARICIREEYRGRGLAFKMVTQLIDKVQNRGFKSVRISAEINNIPALKTYNKLGFNIVNRAALYEGEYFLLEKCF